MSIRARVRGVRLTTVLDSVIPVTSGIWALIQPGKEPSMSIGSGSPDDLTVAAVLGMSVPDKPAPGQLPLSGAVDAKYFQRGGKVQINRLEAHSPATTLDVTGLLGVYPLERAFQPRRSSGQPQPGRVR